MREPPPGFRRAGVCAWCGVVGETSASRDLDLHALVVFVVLDGEDDHRRLYVTVRALEVEKGPGVGGAR